MAHVIPVAVAGLQGGPKKYPTIENHH